MKIESFQNKLRLRWSYGGKRFCLSTGLGDNKENKITASKLASEIEHDMSFGKFDPTLNKYKYGRSNKPVTPLELWDNWVATLHLESRTLNGHYRAIRRMIENSECTNIFDLSKWYQNKSKLAAVSWNNRLSYLKRWSSWAKSNELIVIDPFATIASRKEAKKKPDPFSKEELEKIFEEIPKQYLDYTLFIYLTGCRPSEAIGLRRCDIDFDKGLIHIHSTLARGDKGHSHASARIRKETKTGEARTLKANKLVMDVLNRHRYLTPYQLIFRSKGDLAIDDRTFVRRVWNPLLKRLGIRKRRFYCLRHSFASHAASEGVPITIISKILGHSDPTTTLRYYAAYIGVPELPEL